MGRNFAEPWADFEHAGIEKLKAEPGHEVYPITDEQLNEWKKAAEPVERPGPTRCARPAAIPTRS